VLRMPTLRCDRELLVSVVKGVDTVSVAAAINGQAVRGEELSLESVPSTFKAWLRFAEPSV